ncbi:MAG: hypothetical protein ACI85Q_001362 [Salibacteraceae bacterium]|jgi:hypothetical protein
MKVYNRIMEIFWLIGGITLLGLATYLYFSESEYEKLRYLYLAGSMAVFLSVFRMVYRKYLNDNSDTKN